MISGILSEGRDTVNEFKEYMKTIINAIMAWVRELTKTASDDEIIDILIEEDALMAVHDSDGAILTDENGNILLW